MISDCIKIILKNNHNYKLKNEKKYRFDVSKSRAELASYSIESKLTKLGKRNN
jgi:hypothetical protein